MASGLEFYIFEQLTHYILVELKKNPFVPQSESDLRIAR